MFKNSRKKIIVWFMPILVSMFVSGCGGGDGDPILGQAASETSPTPTVVAVTPVNNETAVSYNIKHITAEFSVPMDGATLTPDSFTLSKGDPAEEITAVSIEYADNVVDFTLPSDANLTADTLYTATITTVAKSADGVALASNYVWSFTTGAIPDTTRPMVLLTSPGNNDFNVSITKTVTATFSEAMKSTSIVAAGTFTVKETNSTSANISGVVSYDVANKVVSFNPTADLTQNTDYTAIITTAAEDLAGNVILNDYSWTFTTAATIPPRVVAVVPVNNEADVSYTTKHITAEFSVPMDNTTLTTSSFTLAQSSTPTLFEVGTVAYANKVADLTLTSNLSPYTNYTATVTTGAKDTDGVALLSDYVWTFTTGAVPDTTRPTIPSTSPRNNDVNVSIKKIVTATFSEPMKASSITATAPATFTLMETNSSANVDGTVSYSVINNIASFKPSLDLTPGMNYTAIVTTAAQDLAGNAMAADYNWTFRTADANATVGLVDFGQASTFGIAATAGITNTNTAPITQIDGDVVLNPTAECNAVAVDGAGGIGLCGSTTPTSAPTINGTVYSKTPPYPDTTTAQYITDELRAAYLSITPANMPGGTAIAAGTTLGAPIGNAYVAGDNYFTTGVYTSNTSILITGDLTLDAEGDPNATFVFQSASTVGSMPNTRILLIGGAKASNVYWQAGSDVTLQTATIWNGNILAYRDITMVTGASSCGRLFAGAFTDGLFVFDSNRVSVPGNPSAPAGCE